jgi:hypothetical protein
MFAAMSSRMPAGGIVARYEQIVQVIFDGGFPVPERFSRDPSYVPTLAYAEEQLTTYPIPPKVQEFFNRFVLNYGHSSIMELTGNPAVYTEGISWYTAYLLFDDPLCAGQEFSTRAVRHKNWPMARECYEIAHDPDYVGAPRGTYTQENTGWKAQVSEEGLSVSQPNPVLKALHDDYFDQFGFEVNAWKKFFSEAENRAAYGIKDKEPFRPALDRARCLIPGTISTGCCHTGHLRGRARILRDGSLIAQSSGSLSAVKVWDNIRAGYAAALPGLADMGLREAVYGSDSSIPAHLIVLDAPEGEEVSVKLHPTKGFIHPMAKPRAAGKRQYLDPTFNQLARVDIAFRSSLAVARDWHRHRTMYPWSLDIVRDENGLIKLHRGYELKSPQARDAISDLLRRSTEAFDAFMAEGNQVQAMLCLPLGTEVLMSGQGGLRDVVYMLELRGYAHGANFEYKKQALEAIEQLKAQIELFEVKSSPTTKHLSIPIDIMAAMGFREAP